MTKDEALRLALEALESTGENNGYHGVTQYFDETIVDQAITAIKAALEAKDEPVAWFWFDERDGGEWIHIADNQINADKFGNAKVIPLYTTPPQQEAKDEPVAWKLVPIEPTNEMLKAMDECSTEGYDERLPAGIASSVYMAAVEVAPKPPQQKINNEPKCVAIVEVFGKDWRLDYMALPVGKHKLYAQQYLYTTLPPQRTWVGLTDDDRVLIKHDANYNQFMTAGEYAERVQLLTEARLKDKNT